VRLSSGFLLRFFALAGLLFALWSFAGVGDAYARAVVALASPIMRVASGFHVDRIVPTPNGLDVVLRRDQKEVVMPFQPRELFSGVIPFLALLGATAALPPRRRLRAAGWGLAILFVFHMGLVILGPFMTGMPQARLGQLWMRRINHIIDIFYSFYGLVGFAALPFLLWFVLTQRGRVPLREPDPPRR
jgi:hypothetical protein